MLSRIVSTVSLNEILKTDPWIAVPNEIEVNKQVEQYCLGFKKYIPVQTVETGDIVTVELKSNTDFFNRTIKINVGKGFFDKELENRLLGMTLDETAVAEHYKAGNVTIHVIEILRLCIPQLTDELAMCSQLDGVRTADEYRRYISKELMREEAFQKAYDYFIKIIEKSVFSIDESEIDSLVEQEMNRCRSIAKEQGLVFDEMSKEQLLGSVGQPDIPSFKRMVRELYTEQLSIALLYLLWKKQNAEKQEVLISELQELSYQAQHYLADFLLNSVTF